MQTRRIMGSQVGQAERQSILQVLFCAGFDEPMFQQVFWKK